LISIPRISSVNSIHNARKNHSGGIAPLLQSASIPAVMNIGGSGAAAEKTNDEIFIGYNPSYISLGR